MVNVYKGIGKENCALLFVCFCIFSLMKLSHVSIEYVCVYANCLVSHYLCCTLFFWKCVVVHCGLACGWEGPMNPPCGH